MLSFGFGVRFGFFFGNARSFDVFSAVELVHSADYDEDDKSNEEEVNNVLEEVSVGNVSNRIGAEEVWDIESEARKIKTTSEKTRDRHNDVVDKRFNNGSEGATDGDTDSEIDDATAVDKFFEFLDEIAFGDTGDDPARCGAGGGGAMLGSVRDGCLWG